MISRKRTSLATGREIEVDEEAETAAKDEGTVRDTEVVDLRKDPWSFTFDRETVKSTGANV